MIAECRGSVDAIMAWAATRRLRDPEIHPGGRDEEARSGHGTRTERSKPTLGRQQAIHKVAIFQNTERFVVGPEGLEPPTKAL